MLEDDLLDSWEEINSFRRGDIQPWEFIFNAKDHELPDDANDLEQFRLPANELERLGRDATRLRELCGQHMPPIYHECTTYVRRMYHDSHPTVPSRGYACHVRANLLAKEEERQEPHERGVSHKYRRRRFCELSIEDVVGISHAVHIQRRFYRDIAEEFCISIGMVSRIARKNGTEHIDDRLAEKDRNT